MPGRMGHNKKRQAGLCEVALAHPGVGPGVPWASPYPVPMARRSHPVHTSLSPTWEMHRQFEWLRQARCHSQGPSAHTAERNPAPTALARPSLRQPGPLAQPDGPVSPSATPSTRRHVLLRRIAGARGPSRTPQPCSVPICGDTSLCGLG